jgi:hypothetical protein
MPAGNGGLSPRLRKVLEDMAERIIPSGGPDYPGARDVHLADQVIEMIQSFPGAMRGFRAALMLWELSPLFLSFRFRTFSRLSPEGQNHYLESWEKSRFFFRRAALTGLKGLFMVRFYGDARVHEKIGYREGCLQPLEQVVPPWSPEEAGR